MENTDRDSIDRLIADMATGSRTASHRALELLVEWWERHDPAFDQLLDALVVEARSGSKSALELVLTAVHQLGLARPAITRLVVDPDAVGEIAQSTLVKVEVNITRFEGRSKFRTWLHTVARNEALMYLRRQKGEPVDSDVEIESTSGSERRMSSVIATRRTVRDALEALPEPYRETMLLRVDDELDYEQISEILGVPVGTVRSRLAKARSLLAEQLSST